MLMIVYALLLGLYVEAVKAVFLPLLAIYFAALKERPFRMVLLLFFHCLCLPRLTSTLNLNLFS